jgi:hypothetical protein
MIDMTTHEATTHRPAFFRGAGVMACVSVTDEFVMSALAGNGVLRLISP